MLKKLPIGNNNNDSQTRIHSTHELGQLVSAHRKSLRLNQLDIAGMANTGNRFIVDLEAGKSTIQLQKVLDVLELLGLEIIVRPKSIGMHT